MRQRMGGQHRENWEGLLIGIYRQAQDGISEINMKTWTVLLASGVEWSGVKYFIASDRLSNGVIHFPRLRFSFRMVGWNTRETKEASKHAKPIDSFRSSIFILVSHSMDFVAWYSSTLRLQPQALVLQALSRTNQVQHYVSSRWSRLSALRRLYSIGYWTSFIGWNNMGKSARRKVDCEICKYADRADRQDTRRHRWIHGRWINRLIMESPLFFCVR